MLSFFYEGDLVRLGGGIIIERRIRKTPISSDFLCDMYLNKKKYPCKVRFPKYGGYEISDVLEDKDEALDYVYDNFKSDKSLLMTFMIRWILKLLLHIASIALPVFLCLMFVRLTPTDRILGIIVTTVFEVAIFLINGVLNRI